MSEFLLRFDMLMFLQERGVDLLSIRGTDPSKYAIQLMDILFTDQEMASSCYVASTKKTKKPGLDPVRVTLLEGNCYHSYQAICTVTHFISNNNDFVYFLFIDCVKAKFKCDDSSFQAHADVIRQKGTQKCLDKAQLLKKKSSTKE